MRHASQCYGETEIGRSTRAGLREELRFYTAPEKMSENLKIRELTVWFFVTI